MKTQILLLCCILFSNCKSVKKIQYIEGLVNCNVIHANQMNRRDLTFEESQPHCIEGVQMPSFKATTLDGKLIDDAYFKGKVTVVNFWFASCHPCVAEIPGFNEIVKKVGTKKVNYLAIGRDDAASVKEFLTEHPWQFDQVADAKKLVWDVFDIMWGFPTTFVVDKNAKIVMAFSGGKDDERATQEIQKKLLPKIQELLKK